MKYIKNKNILVVCIVSVFLLVQINNSVYNPTPKLAAPAAKPIAKPKLRTAPPVEITIPAGTTGIGTVALGGDKGIEDISAIFSNNFKNDLLTTGQTVTGTVTATNIAWKSTSGVTLNTGYLSGGTIEMFAFYTRPTDPSGSVNHTVTAGDTIKIVGIKAPPVTIHIPANLQLIEFGKNTNITDLSNFLAALNNGETFTGTIDSNKTLTLKSATSATTATGTFWTLPNTITYECTADIDATSTQSLNVGTTVTIIGTKTPPPVTITIPSNVSKILLGGTANSFFDNPTAVITAINKGETLRGTINSKNVLTLGSATNAKVATGTFVTKPNQISYRDDIGYTNIPVNPGTFVTITLNKTFIIDLTTNIGFKNFTAFNLVTASGKQASGNIDSLLMQISDRVRSGTLYGKCSQINANSANGTKIEFYNDPDHKNLLATFTSTETVAWIAWTTNNNPNSGGKLNSNIFYIAQQNGTFQINIKYPSEATPSFVINPFITVNTYKLNKNNSSINFFSKFNKAIVVSNYDTPGKPRQAVINDSNTFLSKLSDCVNTIYDYIGNNDYDPLFNKARNIYCKFSNNGSMLQLYKDQALTSIIGTFSLPSPQKGEYISKLSLYTDAYISNNKTIKDPRIGSDGYINFVMPFDENIVLNNGLIPIELINPNDNAYQTLSQIKDFTVLVFSDTDNNLCVIDSAIINKLNDIYKSKNNNVELTDIYLVKQAWNGEWFKDTKYCDLNHVSECAYSSAYHYRIMIYSVSQQIKFDFSYNAMIVWDDTDDIGFKEIVRSTSDTEQQTSKLKNIATIKYGNSVLDLTAPVTTDQIFFYLLDLHFNADPGNDAYMSFEKAGVSH